MAFFLEDPRRLLPVWLLVMSLALFFTMGSDKRRARRGLWRVPERRLFGLAALGGAVGGCLGMLAFRHKTRHWRFVLGFPLLAAAQLALCVYLLS